MTTHTRAARERLIESGDLVIGPALVTFAGTTAEPTG